MGNHTIRIFEHESLTVGHSYKGVNERICFEEKHRKALECYFGTKGVPYFTLIYKGIRFCEFVGVINVGDLTIEVLPKIDREEETDKWHNILVDMLRYVGLVKTHATSYASLQLKSNSILDLYFELFINECEWLLHKGLIKKYHKEEGNQNALKGNLIFSKQISQNLIHQERFYTSHTVYDREHPLNQVLYKTLGVIKQINPSTSLHSRISNLLIDFPELSDIQVDDAFFEKFSYNRKTEPYKTAIEIARLILLNYHPDISSGKNNVLAIMFDMNMLWEAFILKQLKSIYPGQVRGQVSKDFWKGSTGTSRLRPDIIIDTEDGRIVLDTKWKIPQDQKPAIADLHQLYSYSELFKADKVALVYPSNKSKYINGKYCNSLANVAGLLFLSICNKQQWSNEIKNGAYYFKEELG